jgi:uncharacterized membrane protein
MSYESSVSLADILLIAVTLIGVYFVPGFIWSYVFFPERTRLVDEPDERSAGIGIAERMVLSVALSLALVPLVLFVANQVSGVPVDATLTGVTALVVVALGLILLYLGSRSTYARLFSIVKSLRGMLFKS